VQTGTSLVSAAVGAPETKQYLDDDQVLMGMLTSAYMCLHSKYIQLLPA